MNEKTIQLLELMTSAGYDKVVIGYPTDECGWSNGPWSVWGIHAGNDPRGYVNTDGEFVNDESGWPAVWAIVEYTVGSFLCANSHQAQLLNRSVLAEGVYILGR